MRSSSARAVAGSDAIHSSSPTVSSPFIEPERYRKAACFSTCRAMTLLRTSLPPMRLRWILCVTIACAVPNSVFVEYIPQMEPILKRPLIRRDGYAYPFDTPGHGIEFDEEALERLSHRSRDRRKPLAMSR